MHRLILTLSLLCITILSSGQFAPIGAEWYYASNANGAAPPLSEYYHYQSQIDTIVAGHSCRKISVTYYQYTGAITNQPPVFTYQAGDTVYYFNTVYSEFFPLYIFNVSQGDTLTFHSPTIPNNPADSLWISIVDSVTNFIVGADTLQRVYTTEPNVGAFSWWGGYIELLGCPFLMLPQPHIIFPEWDGPMRCYSDSTHYYNFFSFACDYQSTMEVSEYGNHDELLVFPNPATGQINIRGHSNQKYFYNIYNSFGQLVKSGFLESNITSIQLNELTDGIYNVQFAADNKFNQQLFILQKQNSH